jgi:hypothetical protein
LRLKGDYAEGWREYEWRWKECAARPKLRNFGKPPWRGDDLSGKILLVHTE